MTGEMYHIDPVTAIEPDGTVWEYHAAVAKALREDGHEASVQPFDQYQGPYVLVGKDIRVGERPYQVAVRHLGVVRLWLSEEDGKNFVYREDNSAKAEFFPGSIEDAVEAARKLMEG